MIFKIGKKEVPILLDEVDFKKFRAKGNFFNITSHGYVRILRYIGIIDGKMKYSQDYLHRMIMKVPKDLYVDHINGDRLDNRKKNLRICTNSQNCQNTGPRKGKSRFKGVHPNKSGKWTAQISKDDVCYSLGSFFTEEEAAKAYNERAKELHGEYAWLNKI